MDKGIFGQLEALARRIQLKYMAPRRTTEVVEFGRIRFHPRDRGKKIMVEYRKRIERMRLG